MPPLIAIFADYFITPLPYLRHYITPLIRHYASATLRHYYYAITPLFDIIIDITPHY